MIRGARFFVFRSFLEKRVVLLFLGYSREWTVAWADDGFIWEGEKVVADVG